MLARVDTACPSLLQNTRLLGVGKPTPAIFYTLSPEMPRHSENTDLDRLRGFASHSCRSTW